MKTELHITIVKTEGYKPFNDFPLEKGQTIVQLFSLPELDTFVVDLGNVGQLNDKQSQFLSDNYTLDAVSIPVQKELLSITLTKKSF